MDGVITRRDLTEGIARAFVWGAFIAAVPVAIWGSILKAKSKREPLDTPPTAPHSVASTSPTSQPSPPELTSLEQPTIQNRQIAREPQPKSLIMKPEPEGKPADDTTMDDEAFYEQVAGEIESDTMKSGLWTKAFAEAEGDHDRAKAFYIRLRVAQLVSERDKELEELQRLETQRLIAEKQAREEAVEQKRQQRERELHKLQEMEAQREFAAEQARREAVEAQAKLEREQRRNAERGEMEENAPTPNKAKESRSDTEKFFTSFIITLAIMVIIIVIGLILNT